MTLKARDFFEEHFCLWLGQRGNEGFNFCSQLVSERNFGEMKVGPVLVNRFYALKIKVYILVDFEIVFEEINPAILIICE